jgi:hypothetical protein
MGLTKATIRNLDSQEVITALFNPTEYTIAKECNWETKSIVGKDVPSSTFKGSGGRSLKLDLFFDVLEKSGGNVRDEIDKLFALTLTKDRKSSGKKKVSRPPFCLFQWGGNWQFTAYVASLSVRYTLFREDGIPVRATASVTFKEADDQASQKGTNPTSHALPGYRHREVRLHDTLALIAYEEYQDAAEWRRIALANGIDNPLGLAPGRVLAIPPMD